MVIYPIRYYGDPILRQVATPVHDFDDQLSELVADMRETMYHANGIGLAAPQVGLPRRLFLALQIEERRPDDESAETTTEAAVDINSLTNEEKRERWGVIDEHVMINPRITLRSGIQYGQDGCLSVPGLFVEKIKRAAHVHVNYQDIVGKWHELDAYGHFAHVIQHEYDHLEGILFFDRLPREERQFFMESHRSELAEIQRQAKALLRELKRGPTPIAGNH